MFPGIETRLILIIAVYGLTTKVILSLSSKVRDLLFTAVNILAVFAIFYWQPDQSTYGMPALFLYLVAVLFQFYFMRFCHNQGSRMTLLPMFSPILFLALVKYVPLTDFTPSSWQSANVIKFVGVSYLAFRLSYTAMELRSGIISLPSLGRYLSYAFFAPIILIGPISRYSVFERSVTTRSHAPIFVCIERIVVGMAKYFFLANIFNQLSYSGLIYDGYPHHATDLLIACVAYYLYIYGNFSGFCDMTIGFSKLLGIDIEENFDHPLTARNIKDFWNRWHITLSVFMRDMMFNPLSKTFGGWMGAKHAPHAIALSVFIVFVTVGVWHGVGWNFFWFGVVHAVGVVANQYYGMGLKKWLSKENYKAYNKSRFVRGSAIAITFLYVSVSFLFFANSMNMIREILGTLT